jgi:DNA processing protein
MLDQTQSLVALNMVPKVGSVKVRLLLRHFSSPGKVLEASESALKRVDGISEKTAQSIVKWREYVNIDDEFAKVQKAGLHIVTLLDEEYPNNLKEIYDPPIILYVKGKLEPQDKYSIALVGSRRATLYGRETAQKIAYQLARNSFTVVSGLAYGIDSAAHHGALKGEGRTIAVIGSGFNNPYPPESVEMFDKIAENGAVISEFPMDTHPDKINFPIRNRVISGLSLGIVVIEAPTQSGALITADHALAQNRLVFAVPGRIDAPTFKGNHKLLKQGAKLVESVEDILEEFDYLFPQKEIVKGRFDTEEVKHPSLSETEGKIFAALSDGEKYIDDIIGESGLSPTEVSAILLQLEMRRIVKQLPGKLFVRSSLYQG